MNVDIKPADLKDETQARVLVDIIVSYADGPGGQGTPLSLEARANLVQGLLNHPCASVLLAFVDDQAVGTAVCVWGFSTFVGKPLVNIHDLVVLPTFQGRGIGRALLGEVERQARDQDCCKITLEVHDNNQGAKKLYRSYGFGPWDSPTLFVSKML